jgi:hypothetical protein
MLQAQPATPNRPTASPLCETADTQKGNEHQGHSCKPPTCSKHSTATAPDRPSASPLWKYTAPGMQSKQPA